MPSYLVETFLPRAAAAERGTLGRRASSAAEAMTKAGTRVRFTGLIHVPEDEIGFFGFSAASAEAVAAVADRAGLRALRVVEAISFMEGASTCAVD